MTEELKKDIVERKITSGDSYIKALRKVVYNMFDLDPVAIECKKIYIDVNSCLSIMFRGDQYNTEECTNELQKILEKFMNDMILNKIQLIFLFTLEPSQAHIDVFPDWCKERYARVNIMKSDFLKKFLVAIKSYSEKNNSIKLINTHKVHPALVVYQNEVKNKKRFLVLSKDLVFQCINLKNCSVWNGSNFVDMDNPNRDLPDSIELAEPDILLPYALALMGSTREEFKGMPLYGPYKSSKYINKYKIEIKLGVDHPLKEHLDKYSVLFDIHKLLEVNKQDIPIV